MCVCVFCFVSPPYPPSDLALQELPEEFRDEVLAPRAVESRGFPTEHRDESSVSDLPHGNLVLCYIDRLPSLVLERS